MRIIFSALRNFGVPVFFLILLNACSSKNNREKEIAQIPMAFEVDRFDKVFAEATSDDLLKLKANYPLFFPEQYEDSVWLELMTDTLNRELHREVVKAFPDFKVPERELHDFFQRLKYYYPDFNPPQIYTLITQVDYDSRVILADSLLLIGLDVYLGADHPFYDGIQRYFTKNFSKEQIVVDVAQEYAELSVAPPRERDFLDFMIYYGKILYYKQQLLPEKEQHLLIGYTREEWEWAAANERQIWGYFIEQKLLYAKESDLRRKFFDEGPFTRFGLELDAESPAKLGQYTGWKIVDYFARKNKQLTLTEILDFDNKELFNQANYKPKQN